MPIPKLPEVRIALWEQLGKSGGSGRAQDIINNLAQRFQLTQAEREQRDPSGPRTFDHAVHSAIAQSRKIGWIEPVEVSGEGIWKLTSVYFADFGMEEKIRKCKCGCGENVQPGAVYVPGHDSKHRSQLIEQAGGLDKLAELLKLMNAYITGEIGESELAKGIRRLRK